MPLLVIPTLEALKRALGMDVTDVAEDTYLEETEGRVVAWVEEQTEKRWRNPAVASVEYLRGSGRDYLITASNNPASVSISERAPGGSWEDVEETAYEVRGRRLVRVDGAYWHRGHEYRVNFTHGYALGAAPGDIQDLIIELVDIHRDALNDEQGITGETLGDYSYSVDLEALGSGKLSDLGKASLERHRPHHS